MRHVALCAIIAGFSILASCKHGGAHSQPEKEDPLAKAMSTWVGHHYSELMLEWGSADGRQEDGKGGMILTYFWDFDFGQYGGVHQKREFFVDPKGIIYAWRYGPH
jgi:hypothetical protein